MKKSLLVTSVLTATLSLASFSALARGICDESTTPSEKKRCLSTQLGQADKKLNKVYSDLMKSIKSADTKASLKNTEQAWIKYRDATCSENGTPEVDCLQERTRERTKYLSERLMECKAGKCNNQMIGEQSWD
jgi:uncharacterized protein YecT (DUF1311 family)